MSSDPHVPKPSEAVAQTPGVHGPAASAPPTLPPERPTVPPRRSLIRWLVIGGVVLVVVGVGLYFGVPALVAYFNTVSTDDAFVNGHVSFISARGPDTVLQVRVDDNDFVREGDVLLKMDPEPFAVTVDVKKAAVEVAQANVEQARATVRSEQAAARGSWYTVLNAQEKVRFQIATLQHDVASLHLQQANLDLAQKTFSRTQVLFGKQSASQEELEQQQAGVQVARQQVSEA